MTEATVDRPTTGADAPDIPSPADLEARLETHRTELTGYCYRILGSAFEAEDAVQETFVRAWRNLERFEGRSSFRSWLYKIATNVYLDMKSATQRRARPIDLNPAVTADTKLGEPLPDSAWVEPVPDERTIAVGGDPADVAMARESIRLAFVAALQHLPPKQRAVLILREVLRWKAEEVADLLDTSTASVNSALQRARATLSAKDLVEADPTPTELDDAHRALLDRYVAAFEQYDMNALTALLNEDARWSMPPYELWLRTNPDIVAWCLGPGIGCRGSRLVPINVNGSPGFGQYKPDPINGGLAPWSIQVLELEPDGSRIAGITFFLDTERFFPLFGLPPHLDA
ncbi:MAG TPA: sigma-70 family RNA polymerase sigma factor [Candidatus Limnocylindrales bacterium]|nr:sigma-70 family RNA polymerase sigma factor [Candidatus Limnocylindrales bacterium]